MPPLNPGGTTGGTTGTTGGTTGTTKKILGVNYFPPIVPFNEGGIVGLDYLTRRL
jgi:hypothetical protein